MRMLMVLVMSGALAAGACAPRAKPVGYVGGTALAIAGAAMMAQASAICDDSALGCITVGVAEGALGTAAGLTGLAVLLVTAVSPSAPEAPSPPKAEPPVWTPPSAPAAEPQPAWPPLAPSRSPSAPSGSPLAFD